MSHPEIRGTAGVRKFAVTVPKCAFKPFQAIRPPLPTASVEAPIFVLEATLGLKISLICLGNVFGPFVVV